jgi:hypothetical protein
MAMATSMESVGAGVVGRERSGAGIRARIADALASPRSVWLLVPLALALMLPALGTGYVLDDLLFRAMKDAPAELPGLARDPFHLYDLTGRSDALLALRHEGGDLPWYTDVSYRISFFRPLSSLSLWVDLALSPAAAWLAHLHSFAWFAVLLVALHRVYRRLATSPFVAGLALLLAAVDEAHATSVGWIANRNAILSVALASCALALFVRGRQDRDRRAAIAGPLVFGVALLGGEMAVAVGAYLVAYAVFLDRDGWKGRLAALAPYGVVLVGWRAVYNLLGHGVRGTGFYVDPVATPGRFAGAIVKHVPTLIMAQLTPIQADMTFLVPSSQKASVLALGAICAALALAVALPLLKKSAVARFATAGMVLACLPLASTEPANRVMLPVGIGGCLLTAELLAAIAAARRESPRPTLGRAPYAIVSALAVATHLVLAPLTTPLWAYFPALFDVHSRNAARSLDALGDLGGRTLVLVHAPDFFFANWAPIFRHAEGLPLPARVRVLAETTDAIEVDRLDDRTLRIRDANGLVRGILSDIVRDAEVPIPVGFVRHVSDVDIEVTEVGPDRKPRAIVCRFARPLEDPSHLFAHWTPRGYAPFALPAVGATVPLAGVDPRSLPSYRYTPDAAR